MGRRCAVLCVCVCVCEGVGGEIVRDDTRCRGFVV
jgi:hypothetical protein